MDSTGHREPLLTVTDAISAEAEAVIEDGLARFNQERSGIADGRLLAVTAADPATGEVLGGLTGRTSLGLLFVDLFFLPASVRGGGLGGRILRLAEEEAIRRGCCAAVLYTISFQAPGFYERHGYRVFGEVECHPPGTSRVFMSKRFDSPG
ncbi:MAG TPA: GNAT family N-acetyltransferase [Kofleriaceae bacterium]|nr:GNAT family N-acetyltransferase [Kofleriaceae bacterium]